MPIGRSSWYVVKNCSVVSQSAASTYFAGLVDLRTQSRFLHAAFDNRFGFGSAEMKEA